MSEQYPGGIISKTSPVPAGPNENNAASGVWNLTQQAAYQQQGIWPTAGLLPTYIEDVFSTYLYTGNGTSQTITNNIDLSTKGGMTWIKSRSAAENNCLFDTARGVNKYLLSNTTDAQLNFGSFGVTAFNTNGFAVTGGSGYAVDTSGATYSSWTFRKQPKFFDVVTFTRQTGGGAQTVNHNLGSVPGCIICKSTSDTSNWVVYHRGLSSPNSKVLQLNTTSAEISDAVFPSGPTSTTFTIDSFNEGVTVVAYIFAHNAGGFGLTGTDNVISCGSFTTNSSGVANVSLGYEPQWLLIKRTNSTGNWWLADSMRGFVASPGTTTKYLYPNLSNAEDTWGIEWGPNATGFKFTTSYTSSNFIYIAIRRGPMKVPTDATKVFIPVANTVSADNTVATTNFPVDLIMSKIRTTTERWWWFDKLRGTYATGPSANLSSNAVYVEGNIPSNGYGLDSNTTFVDNFQYYWNGTSRTFINYALRRAPSFFDEVCYTGTGGSANITHNLNAVPEMIIVKSRAYPDGWYVYQKDVGNTKFLELQATATPTVYSTMWDNTTPTSTSFSTTYLNYSARTYVAYLFATCPGVSKVGSYTGNGTLRTIDCGFTGGARFVLIKCTSSAGDWMVWDTARGMVAGTDYEQAWNTDGSQTNANSVYTTTTGFQLLASPAFDVNVSGQTYIYLAIA